MKEHLPVVVHVDERTGLVCAVSVYSVGGAYTEPVLVPRDKAAETAGRMVAGEVRRLLEHDE